MFDIEGKKTSYDIKWNNISLFENSNKDKLNLFIEYSLQDSICLLSTIIKARDIYWNSYSIDITNTVLLRSAAPSLSMLIYRRNFQHCDIPILNRELDNKIRPSYFGGSSDYYNFYGKNIKYYDVNSLYPP